MTRILKEVAHRPWDLPRGAWIMRQTWHDLLFAHWPLAPHLLREKVPAAFELDLFDGSGWLGLVPFRMTNVGPRGLPAVPGVSAFPELNVRTYVRDADKPGVYFFSLDAGSRLAVAAARILYNLPYYRAAMRVATRSGTVEYESRRHHGAVAAMLAASYRPLGSPRQPSAGSLDYFLTERYCLYNLDRRGAPYRLEIHHPPWRLQEAEAEFTRNTMAAAAGFSLADVRPLLHFAARQDMVAWAPSSLRRAFSRRSP